MVTSFNNPLNSESGRLERYDNLSFCPIPPFVLILILNSLSSSTLVTIRSAALIKTMFANNACELSKMKTIALGVVESTTSLLVSLTVTSTTRVGLGVKLPIVSRAIS